MNPRRISHVMSIGALAVVTAAPSSAPCSARWWATRSAAAAAATGIGAVGGAVAGNAIEKRNRRDDEVYRVSVRFEDGSVRDFDFQRIDDLRVGDRVRWDGGQLIRI